MAWALALQTWPQGAGELPRATPSKVIEVLTDVKNKEEKSESQPDEEIITQ